MELHAARAPRRTGTGTAAGPAGPAGHPEPPRPHRHPARRPGRPGRRAGNPYQALLDYKAGIRRGGRRANAVRSTGPHGNRRIDVTDHVLITRLRDHLRLPVKAIAPVFGIHSTTVSSATILTRRLTNEHVIPLPPAAEPPAVSLRTLGDLQEYAAQHGIEISIRSPEADTAPEATLTTPDTPEACEVEGAGGGTGQDHRPARKFFRSK